MTTPYQSNLQRNLFSSVASGSERTWATKQFGVSRLASVGFHGALIAVALVPWTSLNPPRVKMNETAVMLYDPVATPAKPLLSPPKSSGGGGGGKRQPLPASLGHLPRGADKQLAPPDPEPPKNPDLTLIVEPTIVAPDLGNLRPLALLNVGDPNGVLGAPSSGRGTGGGIGDGDGHGDGKGHGPGAIDGNGGGCCEGTYHVGGGVTAPVVVYRIDPEYSEEARKARFEGTVLLAAIVRKDGRVDVLNLVRSLGFGLDQNAVDALRKWRFRPGTKDGRAVDVWLNIEVSFHIR
jgi:TonB family protein